mgnify:CR=1 FL=1
MVREFTVFPVLNGWVVKIGCVFIAYVDRATIHSDMLEYLTDPDKKEKEMLARYKPDRIFPEIMGGSSGAKMPAEDCGNAASNIERALRR